MYASREQVGKTMVCPDCLETVAVEVAGEAPLADPEEQPAVEQPPASPEPSVEDEDDFRLSEPEVRPSAVIWSKELADAVGDQAAPESAAPPGTKDALPTATAPSDVTPPKGPPADSSGGEFRIKCDVCDTIVYATADEIGKKKKCPDCYTSFVVKRPAIKQKPTVDVMKDADEFQLSEPVDRVVFKDIGEDLTGQTVGQEQIEKAEKEREGQEQERPKLPRQPLWTGVFRFLPYGHTTLVLAFIAVIFWMIAVTTAFGYSYGAQGGLGVFIAMGCSVAVLSMVLTGGAFAAVAGLRLLQDTAAGIDEIETWPDLSFLDWCLEAVFVAVAFAYSMTPGIVLAWIMTKVGIPPTVGLIVSMVSLFALFPVVLLSLMEADSLTAPLTKPILASLQKERSHWCVFYVESVAILIIILVAGLLVYLESWLALFLAALVWSFCWLVYFRLLGRLAWISGTHQNAE
jgi:DNA-directed RNA polymerase subunit M/transcription elongation factor TFIIS